MGEIKIIKSKIVSFNFSSILEENKELKFIQVYANTLPYFRAGPEDSSNLLENLLNELDILFKKGPIRSCGDSSTYFPEKKGDNYELVGAGHIFKGFSIEKNMEDSLDKYFIEGGCEIYGLEPNIKHFSEIMDYFDRGLVLREKNKICEDINLKDENDLPF